MTPDRQYGPWAPGLDQAEQRARLRALRAITRIIAGPRAADLSTLLRKAEHDPSALEPAADALDGLEPLDRRRILGSYTALGTNPQARPFIHVTPRPKATHVPVRTLPRRPPDHRMAA